MQMAAASSGRAVTISRLTHNRDPSLGMKLPHNVTWSLQNARDTKRDNDECSSFGSPEIATTSIWRIFPDLGWTEIAWEEISTRYHASGDIKAAEISSASAYFIFGHFQWLLLTVRLCLTVPSRNLYALNVQENKSSPA